MWIRWLRCQPSELRRSHEVRHSVFVLIYSELFDAAKSGQMRKCFLTRTKWSRVVTEHLAETRGFSRKLTVSRGNSRKLAASHRSSQLFATTRGFLQQLADSHGFLQKLADSRSYYALLAYKLHYVLQTSDTNPLEATRCTEFCHVHHSCIHPVYCLLFVYKIYIDITPFPYLYWTWSCLT